MGRRATGAVHVGRVRSRHVSKSGEVREYESRLVRRSFRKPDGKVGKETLADLSALPDAAVDAVEAVLKGKTLIDAGAAVSAGRSRGHGHVALVHAAAQQLGLPALLGPAGSGTWPAPWSSPAWPRRRRSWRRWPGGTM